MRGSLQALDQALIEFGAAQWQAATCAAPTSTVAGAISRGSRRLSPYS
jgi:hypothetical protein